MLQHRIRKLSQKLLAGASQQSFSHKSENKINHTICPQTLYSLVGEGDEKTYKKILENIEKMKCAKLSYISML